ncbi:MAG: hypothetical protein NT069_03765, partial [Planctomycetota bacterium]|nr:hypothetical protein [Planctomycetota bacterium]
HFETALRAIFRYPRCVIFSYPSWVARLLYYWNRTRPGLPFHPNCLVYCSGEVLHEAQRRYYHEEFGVPVYEEYGSQETGAIANEDEHHVLRLNAEHLLVEILRDGRPVAPGELGEVVVTNLTATLMPFIRYATGDVARQPEHPEFPLDGDRLPRFPKVEGRTSDLLLSAKNQLLPSRPLVDALMTVVNLRWFHLHQSSPMELEIHALTRDQSKRDASERVVANYLGRDLRIGWRTGDAFSPLRSGKHRYVCSPPAARLIAHDKRIDDELARAWPQPVVTSPSN